MSTFADLKNSRSSAISKLNEQLAKLNGPQQKRDKDDERYWQPTVDKAGNGYAVIRFMPAPKGEDVPFVRIFTHGFKGPTGSWYIENSLTTIGQPDPVGEVNMKLWNTGLESDKDKAREQKRKLTYIANVEVVKDPGNPENEGKVFLYKFGKKVFDKVMDSMNPQFADDKPINPFDFWEGANFKLKIRQVKGYRNYDMSEFESPSVHCDDDAILERVWQGLYPLQPFIDPKSFESYAILKAKLDRVLGSTASVSEPTAEARPAKVATAKAAASKAAQPTEDDDEDFDFDKVIAGLTEKD